MNGDRQLQETLKWLAGPVDRSGVWAGIEARAGDRKQPSAPRRRSGLRVAVFASIAVVLVAAMTVGSLEAVNHLGKDQPVVVINDDTAGMAPGSTGQTTQTATSAEGTWLQLPLLAKGETMRTISISALVMDPSDPAILYATTSEGLFKSSDGAGSWNLLSTIPGDVGVLFIDPTSPSTIYVVCSTAQEADEAVSDHLLRSDDGGLTWTDLTEAGAPRKSADIWVATAFDTTTTPSTIYMWDDTGSVWRSTDRGTTWTRLGLDEGMQAFEQADSPRETPPIPAAAQQALDAFLAPLDDQVYLTDADTGARRRTHRRAGCAPGRPRPAFDLLRGDVRGRVQVHRRRPHLEEGERRPSRRGGSAGCGSQRASWSIRILPRLSMPPQAPGSIAPPTAEPNWALILEAGADSVVLAPSNPSRLYAVDLRRTVPLRRRRNELDPVGRSSASTSPPCIQLVLVVADQPDTVFAIAEEVYWGPLLPLSVHRRRQHLAVGPVWSRAAASPVVAADPQHPSTIYVSRMLISRSLRTLRTPSHTCSNPPTPVRPGPSSAPKERDETWS